MAAMEIFSFLFFLLITLATGQSSVTISGRRIFINGNQFYGRGFAFSPVQIGTYPGSEDIFSNSNRAKWEPHLNAMQAAGANVIRIYTEMAGAGPYDQFFSVCESKGIYVIVNYMTPSGAIISDPNVIATAKNATLGMVQRFTNYNAVLAWALGNELNNPPSNAWNANDFANFMNSVITYVRNSFHEKHPHPFLSPLADNFANYITTLESTYPGIVDIWGLQIYRGATFSTVWSDYATASSRPLIITEYGNDAYNSITNQEDQEKQNAWIGYQTVEIEQNSVANNGVCSGGLVFEWNDEWWKFSGGNSSTHDTGGNTDISGHSFDNFVSPEWYGVVKMNPPVPNTITTRKFYSTLKSMWDGCTYPQFNSIDQNNQLINGGFDVADTFYEYSYPLHFVTNALNETLKITNITTTANGYNAQIKNPKSSATTKLKFSSGHTYIYSYNARAASPRSIYSYISNGTWPPISGNNFNAWGRDQCNVSGTWKTCTYNFSIATGNSYSNGLLYIEFGNSELVDFEIDNLYVDVGPLSTPNTGKLKLCGQRSYSDRTLPTFPLVVLLFLTFSLISL